MFLDFEIKLVSEDPAGKLYSGWALCFDGDGKLLLRKQWHNEPLARILNLFRAWTLRCRGQFDQYDAAVREMRGDRQLPLFDDGENLPISE